MRTWISQGRIWTQRALGSWRRCFRNGTRTIDCLSRHWLYHCPKHRPSSFSETSERLGEWYNKPNSPEKIETESAVSSSSVNQGLETQESRDDLQENPSSDETSDETQYRERESVDQEMADPESSNSSANQTMWLVIIIAVVAVPVIFAINRILKSTPK